MTHDDQVAAERARQLLDDPVLQQALESMEETVRLIMLTGPLKDEVESRYLILRLRAVNDFKEALRQILSKGSEQPARGGFA